METPRQTLEELRQLFNKIAGKDNQVDHQEFQKALALKDEYFADRLFAIFDTDKSGTIQIDEFLTAVEKLVFATTEEKLKFAYHLHDINQDDCIEKAEIAHLITASLEQKAFEWFVQLLSQIEIEDTNKLFDLNLYLTGAQQKSDMKSSTLFVAMDLMHSQTKVDLITGLKSRTKTGRPDWDEIFRDLAKQHAPNKVDVFFCGPPPDSQHS